MRKIIKQLWKNKHFWKNITLFCLSILIFFSGVGVFWIFSLKIPDFHSFEERKVVNSTKIYDRTGEVLLYDIHQNTKRTVIPYEEMGVNIKNATVAIEDSEFYQHSGLRIKSVFRAFLTNLLKGSFSQGGSTITQQIIKNSLLTNEKTIIRKIKESILSLKIEK